MIEDFHDRGIYLTEEEYRTGLRALFPEAYQQLSDAELEDIIYDRIAQMSPSEAEGFFNSIGNFLKDKVAPVAVAALPAVATIAGTAFGGPAGAALGGAVGNLAAGAIGNAANVRPNPTASNIGRAATAISQGNYQAALPAVINVSRDVGNAIAPGAGNTVANVAQGMAGLANRPLAGGPPTGTATAGPNAAQASTQLLGFLRSTPFLQSILSSVATGNMGTGIQLPREDGSNTTTSYVEMLEALRHLTENAIAEADNAGVAANLPLESEADRDAYIESLIEDISQYENSLLPNYDSIAY